MAGLALDLFRHLLFQKGILFQALILEVPTMFLVVEVGFRQSSLSWQCRFFLIH